MRLPAQVLRTCCHRHHPHARRARSFRRLWRPSGGTLFPGPSSHHMTTCAASSQSPTPFVGCTQSRNPPPPPPHFLPCASVGSSLRSSGWGARLLQRGRCATLRPCCPPSSTTLSMLSTCRCLSRRSRCQTPGACLNRSSGRCPPPSRCWCWPPATSPQTPSRQHSSSSFREQPQQHSGLAAAAARIFQQRQGASRLCPALGSSPCVPRPLQPCELQPKQQGRWWRDTSRSR
jgi:hypothetical protein